MQVVATTCNGAAGRILEGFRFKMVVIDEATQATEASTLVPLTRGAECVVIAGDPLQLPPTIMSQSAKNDFQFDRCAHYSTTIVHRSQRFCFQNIK